MKELLKASANGVALVLVLPCYLAFRSAALVLGRAKAFPG